MALGQRIGPTHHAGLSTSLLGLEEDGFLVLANRAGFVRPRELDAKKGKIVSSRFAEENPELEPRPSSPPPARGQCARRSARCLFFVFPQQRCIVVRLPNIVDTPPNVFGQANAGIVVDIVILIVVVVIVAVFVVRRHRWIVSVAG